MNKKEAVKKYKEALITATNKVLDTLYDQNEKDTSAPLYEELRRALIDEKELTETQYHLIMIISTYTATKMISMAETCSKAADILTTIAETIQADSSVENLTLPKKHDIIDIQSVKEDV